MRIAQIAPPIESVPPTCYGGTERVVSYLTEELVRQGHRITLFASGDSLTSAELVPCTETALRLTPAVRDPIPYYMLMLDKVRERADEFDILHFHIDQFHFPIFRNIAHRTLTTLHGRQDLPDLQALYRGFSEMPLVSISNAQRRPCGAANFMATVYHGIPSDLHVAKVDRRGSYLAFLGRICPEKRVDHAIAIARAAGLPLKIAAKVDKVDEEYFREAIVPLLNGPDIEFIGEINEHAKTAFLGNASVLLFPIDWPEPFGLTMIEALACGTPVIAWPHGAVPEVLDHGVTGFLCKNVATAVRAVDAIDRIDRGACRRAFEARFTAERMAREYLALYALAASGAARGRLAS
jgi:glycosyltransferase involved in cell wall biosynthesis